MSNSKASDIGLVFYKGLFSDEEVREIKFLFDERYLSFDRREKNSTVLACLDFFVPTAQIVLSPDFLQQIANGAISSFAYDLAKNCILKIWSRLIAKNSKKITGGKIIECEDCIHLCGNGFNAVFPQNADKDIISRYIDKSFEYLSHNSTKQREFLVFDKNESLRRLILCKTGLCT